MKNLSIVFASLIMTIPGYSKAEMVYDPNTGNSYYVNRNPDGSVYVQGSNMGTGNNWNTTIRPNGDMQGVDSNSQPWNYQNSTGNYMNGNGHFCANYGALGRKCY